MIGDVRTPNVPARPDLPTARRERAVVADGAMGTIVQEHDLSLKDTLETLPDGKRIGIELAEEHQVTPEESTSAIGLHHPEATYFAAR